MPQLKDKQIHWKVLYPNPWVVFGKNKVKFFSLNISRIWKFLIISAASNEIVISQRNSDHKNVSLKLCPVKALITPTSFQFFQNFLGDFTGMPKFGMVIEYNIDVLVWIIIVLSKFFFFDFKSQTYQAHTLINKWVSFNLEFF